ncbi:hypothetical protein M440DRAFT_1403846 [Trichoderma longibrachiatum ATCC 18648]|uniref:Uncharacterized protein n=1 Tax=Trichoderma longibrachiatum ATCC 18648 TaxID=983965 RepID=A0A2T4BYQ6_TRILO|nr:hypothetical protein M440DRAFT_1403846 [Trichoderma longibrachiatum ATCC 18648]
MRLFANSPEKTPTLDRKWPVQSSVINPGGLGAEGVAGNSTRFERNEASRRLFAVGKMVKC